MGGGGGGGIQREKQCRKVKKTVQVFETLHDDITISEVFHMYTSFSRFKLHSPEKKEDSYGFFLLLLLLLLATQYWMLVIWTLKFYDCYDEC